MERQKPLAKFRAGQVVCALWDNETQVKDRSVRVLKATIERRYKDRNDEWKSSGSFSRNDIPLAIYCLKQAFAMMIADGGPKVITDKDVVLEEDVE